MAFGDRPAFTIWGTCWVFPRLLEMVRATNCWGAQQTVLNHSHLKGQAWEKKKRSFACGKKVFPKSNIYAMRCTVVGVAHPFMGQCLQGKQSVARLPQALIIVLLAAWGKVLVHKTSNLVADIRLSINVAIADYIRLVGPPGTCTRR